jgi:hypothetical protein
MVKQRTATKKFLKPFTFTGIPYLKAPGICYRVIQVTLEEEQIASTIGCAGHHRHQDNPG